MRGFGGIIHFDQSPVEQADIERLGCRMAVVPPDRIGRWCEGPAAFVHVAKLSFPEDSYDTQPIVGEHGTVLVTDAVLTNRRELADEFGWDNATVRVSADSAFVQAAYERWGNESPDRLEGRFAFVVWHARERRLFAAVDAFAFRPLFFWRRGGRFAFASTLRGLFSMPEIPVDLNEGVLVDSFCGLRSPSNETLYRDVSVLAPASTLNVTADELLTRRYWNPESLPIARFDSAEGYLEQFRALFVNAVRTTLRPTGDVAVMLSGGLDSAAVTAVAAEVLREREKRLKAIHLLTRSPNRLSGEMRDADESSYVRDMQAFSPQIDFQFVTYEPPPLMDQAELEKDFEEHQAPSPALPLRPNAQWETELIGSGVSLLLNGLGGNSLVSPQIRPTNYLGFLAAQKKWTTLAREIVGAHRVYGTEWRTILSETVRGAGWRRPPTPPLPLRMRLLHPDVLARTGRVEIFKSHYSNFNTESAKDFRGGLIHQLTVMMAQQNGISRAVISSSDKLIHAAPMFDRRLNEFCASIPPEVQFRAGWDRRLLRETMRDLLPNRVRLRTTRGFAQSFSDYTFHCHEQEIERRVVNVIQSPVVRQFFNPDMLSTLQLSVPQHRQAIIRVLGWGSFLRWRLGPKPNVR